MPWCEFRAWMRLAAVRRRERLVAQRNAELRQDWIDKKNETKGR